MNKEQNSPTGSQSAELPCYVAKCEGCRKDLTAEEIEQYGDGLYHVVPYYNRSYDEWEQDPCGPVYMTAT